MNTSLYRVPWTLCLTLPLLAAVGCNETVTDDAATGDAAAGQATLSDEELADGWILLFDGETLFGWEQANKANWKVADGAISVSEGEQGLLHTTSQFADYRLKVDFRSAKGTNSGIFLRTSAVPPAARDAVPTDVTTKCYELNIAGADNPFPTGSFVQRKKADGDHQSTDWQTYDVTAHGGHFTVKLDGKLVLDYTDPKPIGRGFIGLQLNSGKVEFRNVKLKPLGLESIFNGKDLTGWKTYPEMQSEFTVTKQGWMNVRNGKGQIETEGTYADFTMQLDVFVDGKALNSGIFFRCIPGEVMNGYESQIHNGYLDGDRTKPEDCGTGGIFRRQNARRVVADDFTWFQKTIHVDGKHVAVWVNGYQVTDFTDKRPADANPRKGLRLEPGTIQIQGHDPTTNLSFRNVQITELPAR